MLGDPVTMAKRGAAALLVLLMCSLPFATVSADTTLVTRDEEGLVVQGDAGAAWSATLDLDATQRGLFVVACGSCEASVQDAAGTTLASGVSGLDLTHRPEAAGTWTLHVIFVVEESATVLLLASTMADVPNRPAPGDDVSSTVLVPSESGDTWWTGTDHVRLDGGWQGAATAVVNVSADSTAYVLAETDEPAWVDVLVQHASSEIDLRLLLQNNTAEVTHASLTLTQDDLPFSHRMYLDADQRAMMLIEGTAPNTGVAVAMAAHPTSGAMDVVSGEESERIVGHGGQITVYDVNDTDAFGVTPTTGTELRAEHLVQGTWVATSNATSTQPRTVWALPDAVALRLTCISPTCAADVALTEASDLRSGEDAQGYVDLSDELLLQGGSAGFLPLNGSANGHLVRATLDVADVFPFQIDAWEDSIHLVKVTVWTSEPVMLELIPIDPITGTVDEDERKHEVVSGQGESLSAQFGRGAHLVRISLVNPDEVLNGTWGSDLATLNYTLEMAHGVVDEGDEPWFEPDEASQIWGARVRWILGFCFLIPVAYLARMQRRRTLLANTLRAQRERLRQIVARLDEGRPVAQERRDLHLALDAVATLDFEDACLSWGQPDLQHRTDELAFAAWRLDRRLAQHGAHVVLVGLAAGPRTWEATALRFDAPIGAACEVKAVEPRFMHHGEDVFLDTIRAGTVVFLTVELDGENTLVDLEVNGLVDAKPRAARASAPLELVSTEEA